MCVCVYSTYFSGSQSFALMIVPKRENILLSHYISSLCSLLQVAFIFTVTSSSVLMKVSLLAMSRISYEDAYFSLCFYFLFPSFCLCPDLTWP